MRPPGGDDREAGTTLIETLVAVSIVGLSFSAVVGGMFTAVQASDINRKQAALATHLASYAEAVKADPYVACAGSYAGASFAVPAGFVAGPLVVAYWDAGTSTFVAACGVDSGLQRVTLSLRSSDNRVAADMQLAKRAS